MKKIMIVVLAFLLIGCHGKKVPPKAKVVEEEPEYTKTVETIEYVKTNQMKELVRLSNLKTEIIDIAVLHDRLSVALLDVVNLDQLIEDQAELIDDVIREELYDWKKELVEEVLEEQNITLNTDDFETLVDRTSYNDAYELMSVYETIFLQKKQD